MNMQDIYALSELLDPEGDEREMVSNPNKGSVLAPGSIGTQSQKELAKPFSQITVKGGRGKQEQQQIVNEKKQQLQSMKDQKNDIWDEKEVQTVPKSINETRERPDVDVLYKQAVGTEDVYGGWSNIDPSSTTCQFLLVKIKLPGSKLNEISLEVQKQIIVAQSIKYYLNYILPYPVKEKEGKAKWIADKEILELTLPIIREDNF